MRPDSVVSLPERRFGALVDEWIHDVSSARLLAPGTVTTYRWALGKFYAWMASAGILDVTEVTRPDFARWRGDFSARPTVRRLFRWLVATGRMEVDPTEPPPPPPPPPHLFDPDRPLLSVVDDEAGDR